MSSADEIVNKLPLMTVTSLSAFKKSRTHHGLSSVKPESVARQFEELCELKPGKYYFAALVEPDFGGIALVYNREIEDGSDGSASPYDTGGTLVGACHPFDVIEDDKEREERVLALHGVTSRPLVEWRDALMSYLEDYYSSPGNYVRGARPDRIPEEAAKDLPARFAENDGDRRAFTWEVRLYEGHQLEDELQSWATDDATVTALKRGTASTVIPVMEDGGERTIWQHLERTRHFVEPRKWDAFEKLQNYVEDTVLK